jgi:hypothetical protein
LARLATEALRHHFRELAARFRRLAARGDDGKHEYYVAIFWGGQLLMHSSETELLPICIPQLTLDGGPASYDAESKDLLSLWVGVTQAIADAYSPIFPINPSHFLPADDGEKQRYTFNPNLWRVRAENYAVVCDLIADGALQVNARPDRIGDGPWSEPNPPSQWAKRFGVSAATFKRRVKDGSIRHKKLTSKSYQIHIDDLPSRQK